MGWFVTVPDCAGRRVTVSKGGGVGLIIKAPSYTQERSKPASRETAHRAFRWGFSSACCRNPWGQLGVSYPAWNEVCNYVYSWSHIIKSSNATFRTQIQYLSYFSLFQFVNLTKFSSMLTFSPHLVNMNSQKLLQNDLFYLPFIASVKLPQSTCQLMLHMYCSKVELFQRNLFFMCRVR